MAGCRKRFKSEAKMSQKPFTGWLQQSFTTSPILMLVTGKQAKRLVQLYIFPSIFPYDKCIL